jgi:hypothetical protein
MYADRYGSPKLIYAHDKTLGMLDLASHEYTGFTAIQRLSIVPVDYHFKEGMVRMLCFVLVSLYCIVLFGVFCCAYVGNYWLSCNPLMYSHISPLLACRSILVPVNDLQF